MTLFELMFIVRPDVEGEEAVDQQIERYGRLIVDNGGEVTAVDKWGRRRFAYAINDFTEGFYVVMKFRAEHSVVVELSRVMRIADEIVRHMVVRLDEPKAASHDEVEAETQAPEEEIASTPAPAGEEAAVAAPGASGAPDTATT